PSGRGTGFDFNCFSIPVSDNQRLPSIGVFHGLGSWIVRTFRDSHTNRKIRLQLIHAGFHFVPLDGLPNLGRPMLVYLPGILDKKYLIGVDPVVSRRFTSDRERETLCSLLENRQQLFLARRSRRWSKNYIRDFEPLQGQQGACLTRKIGAAGCFIVGIVGVAVAFLYPHRLLRQFACRLEIVGVKPFRNYVVVGVQWRR